MKESRNGSLFKSDPEGLKTFLFQFTITFLCQNMNNFPFHALDKNLFKYATEGGKIHNRFKVVYSQALSARRESMKVTFSRHLVLNTAQQQNRSVDNSVCIKWISWEESERNKIGLFQIASLTSKCTKRYDLVDREKSCGDFKCHIFECYDPLQESAKQHFMSRITTRFVDRLFSNHPSRK